MCVCVCVQVKGSGKDPISKTPRQADRQLWANPAEYQRKPRLPMEGVIAQTDEGRRSGNRQGGSKRGWRKRGGSRRELRELKCKIKRIKPFVICYLLTDRPLVSHCSLDLLNHPKLFKPFKIYAGLFSPKGHFIVSLQHFPDEAYSQKRSIQQHL